MKELVADLLSKELKLIKTEIENLVEIPPNPEMGDYAFPCFSLAKTEKKSPLLIAEELSKKLRKKGLGKGLEGVDTKAGYVNFFIDKRILADKVLKGVKINKQKKQKIIIDFSHPNVAKHFGIHNLRSTLIGNSLYKILKATGSTMESINYLGDWGTQFGKLIVAYKKWGKNVKDVDGLNRIYVKFHEQAEKNEELENEARAEFKKLEDGDKENKKLWKNFYDLSMKEFKKVYQILNIDFDEIKGESHFNDSSEVRKDLEKKHLLKKSEGALIVEVSGERPPLIFEKSDEASTYASRDLASIYYRENKKPDKIVYVVDVAQKLHFEQVFEVAKKLGAKSDLIHVIFGRLKFKDAKMSTRKGNIILFEDLLKKAEEKSLKNIEEKSPHLKNKKEVARKVALAGIIFNDLKQDIKLDIVFDWDEALSFEGRTGPYLLYSYARASSIIRKVKSKKPVKILDLKDEEIKLIKKLLDFPEVVGRAASNLAPSLIANYCYELAQIFNEFYHSCPVLGSKEEGFRLKLVGVFRNVFGDGLGLLGISTLDEM